MYTKLHVHGTEATEYVRQAYTEEEREETEYIRKASNYEREINEQWKSDRQQNDRRTPNQQNDRRTPNIDRCQGCGAQGERMHNRGACPLSTEIALNAVLKAISDGFVKTQSRNHSHVTYKRWYVRRRHTEGVPILPP